MTQLIRVGGDCPDGRTCPTVYKTTDQTGDYIVQGWRVTDAALLDELALPTHESAVRIPASLVEVIRGGPEAECG